MFAVPLRENALVDLAMQDMQNKGCVSTQQICFVPLKEHSEFQRFHQATSCDASDFIFSHAHTAFAGTSVRA